MLPWLDNLSSVLAQVVRLQRCVALAERLPPQPKQVSHCLWHVYFSVAHCHCDAQGRARARAAAIEGPALRVGVGALAAAAAWSWPACFWPQCCSKGGLL